MVAVAIAFFLAFKIILVKTDPGFLFFSTWGFESCVFFVIYLLAWLLDRVTLLRKLRLSSIFFYSFFSAFFVLTFFHGFFFEEAAARRFSLLDVGWDSITFFFAHVLPWHGYLLFAASLSLVGLVAALVRSILRPLRPAIILALVTIVGVVVWLTSRTADHFPTPLADLANDVAEVVSRKPIELSTRTKLPYRVGVFNRSAEGEVEIQSPFKKILVFVMEGVTLQTLHENMAWLPKDMFFNKHKELSHTYLNFFSNNQDSRTGLLALLVSRFIPFEAYSDEAVERYKFLSEKSSLVDLMNKSGFETAFAASETEEEMVVFDLPWQHKFTLTKDEYQSSGKDYLCFNAYEFEHSCEDRILFERLVDFIDSHEKVFLFQEFIYGHVSDYYNATQKSNSQYYAEYLEELFDHLRSTNRLDETLIVLTSDHGIRDWGYEKSLSSYRIPLILLHPKFRYTENRNLFSQIDFKDILLAELNGSTENLPANDFVAFVGSTSKSIVGFITNQMDFLLIKGRNWFPYLIQHINALNEKMPAAPLKSEYDPGAYLKFFLDYREYFLSKDFR